MRGIKRLGLGLVLMSVTACAPVVYDATYRAPTTHVSLQATNYRPSHDHGHAYRPRSIEVTVYADNTYLGVYFQPIHLVIAQGQYIAIPAKNRRGRQTTIYAHYDQMNLHFDADRRCRNIHGATRYHHDNSWNQGRSYSQINAGSDYDMAGLRLQIRNVPVQQTRPQHVPPGKLMLNQPVVRQQLKLKEKVPVVRINNRPSAQRVEKQIIKREKSLMMEEGGRNRGPGRVALAAQKPETAKKINKNKLIQKVTKSVKPSKEKKQVANIKPKVENQVKPRAKKNPGQSKADKVNAIDQAEVLERPVKDNQRDTGSRVAKQHKSDRVAENQSSSRQRIQSQGSEKRNK